MAYVYILYSVQIDRYYIGSCKNLDSRLAEHKEKKFSRSFTSRASDWELYYSISELDFTIARRIEKYIKQMMSRSFLIELKQDINSAEKMKSKFASGGGPD